MADIVQFPKPDDGSALVWVCNCGCTVHYHRATGDVECSACGVVAGGLTGEWRLKLPADPVEPREIDSANFKVIEFTDAETFLKRQIMTAKQGDPIAAAVVCYAGGGSSTWGDDISTDERRDWLRQRLSEAVDRMTRP